MTDDLVERLSKGFERYTCFGPAGTVAIFAGNLVHGSSKNTSAQSRRNLYFAYNQQTNKPVGEVRRKHANSYIQNPNPDHLTLVDDDALSRYARAA